VATSGAKEAIPLVVSSDGGTGSENPEPMGKGMGALR